VALYSFSNHFYRGNVCLFFFRKKFPPFDQIIKKVVSENAKGGTSKFLKEFIAVVVAFAIFQLYHGDQF
jgi:hypothetical protein